MVRQWRKLATNCCFPLARPRTDQDFAPGINTHVEIESGFSFLRRLPYVSRAPQPKPQRFFPQTNCGIQQPAIFCFASSFLLRVCVCGIPHYVVHTRRAPSFPLGRENVLLRIGLVLRWPLLFSSPSKAAESGIKATGSLCFFREIAW